MSKVVLQKFFPPMADRLQARRINRLRRRGLSASKPTPRFDDLIHRQPQAPAVELVESFAKTYSKQISDCLTAFLNSLGEDAEIDDCEIDTSQSPVATWIAYDPYQGRSQLQLDVYLEEDQEDEEQLTYHGRLNHSKELIIEEPSHRPEVLIEIYTMLEHLIVDVEDFKDVFGQTLQLAQYLHLLTNAKHLMIKPDHKRNSPTLKSVFDEQSSLWPRPKYREGLYNDSDLVKFVQLEYKRPAVTEA